MLKWRVDWALVCWIIAILISVVNLVVLDIIIPSIFVMFNAIALLIVFIGIFIHLKAMNDIKDIKDLFLSDIDRLKADFELERNDFREKMNVFEQQVVEFEEEAIIIQSIQDDLNKLNEIKNKSELPNRILSILAGKFEMTSGIIYKLGDLPNLLNPVGSFAFDSTIVISPVIEGIGLGGQAVLQKESRVIDTLPTDYLLISSGLGESTPCFLYLLPIVKESLVIGLIEVSAFKRIKIDEVWPELNVVIGNILAKV